MGIRCRCPTLNDARRSVSIRPLSRPQAIRSGAPVRGVDLLGLFSRDREPTTRSNPSRTTCSRTETGSCRSSPGQSRSARLCHVAAAGARVFGGRWHCDAARSRCALAGADLWLLALTGRRRAARVCWLPVLLFIGASGSGTADICSRPSWGCWSRMRWPCSRSRSRCGGPRSAECCSGWRPAWPSCAAVRSVRPSSGRRHCCSLFLPPGATGTTSPRSDWPRSSRCL